MRKINISPVILSAFRSVLEECDGNQSEMQRKYGFNQKSISKYLNGSTKSISSANWAMYYPEISKYLPENVREELNPNLNRESLPHVSGTITNTPELLLCIQRAMMKKGLKDAAELSRFIGYSGSTVERLLDGKINWFPDMLSAVLDHLELSPDDVPMTSGERTLLLPSGMFYNANNPNGTHAELGHYAPVVAWANAAAYIEQLCTDGTINKKWNPEEAEEVVPVPIHLREKCVIFRVYGESMDPTINDGDILYCEQCDNLEQVHDRMIVVVKFADCSKYENCIVCKRFRRAGESILLTSDNPAGKEFCIRAEEIAWIGIVREKTTKLS